MAESDDIHERHLALMIRVLRTFLGNRTTNAEWQREMEVYGAKGWSRPSFMRRLRILKQRGWVRVVGGDGQSISPVAVKISQGESYEATIFEDLSPVLPVSKQSHEAGAAGLAAAKKAALEQLQRKGGKSSAA